jgi:CPA1 family monovalent cation:H+ antiporter
MAVSGPNAEETRARLAATEAALGRLADLETQFPTHKPLIENLRSRYEHEASHSGPEGEGPRDEEELELLEHKEIRDAVLEAQREAVIALRDDGIIGDEILAEIQRDLDLEALRTGA